MTTFFTNLQQRGTLWAARKQLADYNEGKMGWEELGWGCKRGWWVHKLRHGHAIEVLSS